MIRREGARIILSGPVTLANVAEVMAEGSRHLQEGVGTVDVGEVAELDSSLLAMLLAWLREAKAADRDLKFANLPDALRTIAHLYGVEELLPAVSAQH
jgi:phospholipid transport system transporter-binding protein